LRLPHRFPFRLVDREADGGALLCATAAAWWDRGEEGLALPLLVEGVAQSAALLLGSEGGPAERMALAAVEAARLDRRPLPGERLEIRVRLETRLGRLVRVRGELTAGGEEIGAATVVLVAG
jgi:3-hydroxymyristoyl/3-hydroxydecanoyl-(acyl carrier protein) dehydratase